jgi:hypothetical protein
VDVGQFLLHPRREFRDHPAGQLLREIAAWETPRNSAQVRMDWRFTTADARIKLKHLYPVTTVPSQPSADATAPQPLERSA